MAKEYICPICRNKFEFKEGDKHIGRRYYHAKCYNAHENIHERCKKMFGENYSSQRIENQIKSIMSEGKTIEGINYCLFYWYDIKKNDPSKANFGINIVSYVYGEASEYYKKMKAIEQKNNDLNVEGLLNPKVEEYKISRTKIKKPTRVRLFKLD